MEFQFRKAFFGGFHRQDVVDYLDQTTRANGQQLAELQSRIAQLEEENQKLPELEAEKERLQGERDATTAQLESLQAKLKCAEGENITLAAANQEMQEKLFVMTPDAEAYRSVKDRAAGMELDAHVRAQKTIDEADKYASALRAELHQWARQMKSQYGTTRGELDIALLKGMESMKTTQKTMEQLTQTMSHRDRALEQLVEQWTKKLDKK